MADELDITPEVGKEYPLCLGINIRNGNHSIVLGRYVGLRQVKTHHWFRVEEPEGHVFVHKLNDTTKFYCTRTDSPKIREYWLSDGDDSTSCPVGFPVEEVNWNKNKREQKEILEIIAEAVTK